MVLQRQYGKAQFKILGDQKEGIAQLIVAGLGNIDHGDDVILPGAFDKSIARKPPKGVWSHQWSLPVAKTLEAKELQPGDTLIPAAYRDHGALYVKAQFNLDTQRGREAFSDIQGGYVDEFSVGYIPEVEQFDHETGLRQLSEVDWIEWSPVLAGMNPDTGVINTKGRSAPKKDFPIADRDTAWDAAAAEKRVRAWAGAEDEPNAKYADCFFWYDGPDPDNDDGLPDSYGDYKLLYVDIIDGTAKAVPKAVFACAAAMQGARGGVNMPDGDRAKVKANIATYYSRMAKQFKDDSIKVPWSNSGKSRLRLADETDALLDDAARLVLRFESLYGPEGMRTKEGRVLSAANKDKIQAIHQRMGEIMDHASAVQDHCNTMLSYGNTGKKSVSDEEMQAAFTKFMAMQARLRSAGYLNP